MPSETSGRRGSRTTTCGRWARARLDRRIDVAGRPDDVEPVPDAQDPGHALARPVVGVDDEDAEGARHAEVVGGVVGLVGG